MARPRAADYDIKRAAVLAHAAKLFADQGYDRTSMAEIAQALGVSKALFYHYFPAKDALLFAIIHNHLSELVAAVEAAAQVTDVKVTVAPRKRLQAIISAILDCYRDADAEHKIQINHLSQLGAEQQATLHALERRLVELMAGAVSTLNPDLPRKLLKPVTMSIFGTLNWKYMWFREGGAVSREDYAKLVTQIFADGLVGVTGDRLAAE
jgi:TetR/AcrR family transcriptional regulator